MYIFKKSLNKSNIVETIESVENLRSIPEEIKSTFLDVLYEAQEEIIEDNETEITVNIKVDDTHCDNDIDSDEIIDIEDSIEQLSKGRVDAEAKMEGFMHLMSTSLNDILFSGILSSEVQDILETDIVRILNEYRVDHLFANTEEINTED